MGTIRAASAIRQGEVARIGLNLNRLGREPYSALGIMADRREALTDREEKPAGTYTSRSKRGLFQVAARTHEKEHGDRKQKVDPRRQ